MKRIGIPIKGITLDKNNKIKPKPAYRSASAKIAARKSKKVRVRRPIP